MEERARERYFILLRIVLLLILEVYIILSQSVLTGASAMVLLLLALFAGVIAAKELAERRWRLLFLGLAGILLLIIRSVLGEGFALLGVYLGYEVLTYFRPGIFFYLLPLGFACAPGGTGTGTQLLTAVLTGIIYCQHDFVVESYRRQTKEDTLLEQSLKRSMERREQEMQKEARRSLLMAENQALEERAELSQTLHDRLGHSINGSVYQLEAVKILMEQDPAASEKMVQAVIDQLRGGMDEIREILRRKRPRKYTLAILQLERLCEDCRKKGVDAGLTVEGDLNQVPDKYLEIILDNAYEAVSNSMKYAKCSKIRIGVYVLNRVVRCSIADDGAGCGEVIDGMGISGMRKRVREVNGVLDFETEAGFTVNMLLPL